MNKEKTGQLIRDARIKSGLTQAELGDMLGVTNKAVSRWENGESFPDVGVMEAISDSLHIRIEDIVTGGEADRDISDKPANIVNTVRRRKREYRRWLIVSLVAALHGALLLYLGFVIFRGYISFANGATVSVLVSIALFVIIYSATTRPVTGIINSKAEMVAILVSAASAVYCVFITAAFISAAIDGKRLFRLTAPRMGPFLNNQFIALFIINLTILAFFVIKGIRNRETFRFAVIPAGIATMLALAYSAMLHNMSEPEGFMSVFLSKTGQVCFIAVIATVIKLGIEKHKRN